ncbi:MAG: hypothetical protein KAI47_10230 [Deltaproteobacteria bacterium]|nr:hypothetical protein [Deltaproteobacteria bacterium]
MTQIDQFEAVFRAAAKTRFNYENISIASILVIADLDDYQAHLFGDRLRTYLKVLGKDVAWHITKADECRSVGQLLDVVEAKRPDLICTYRNVHSGGWRWPMRRRSMPRSPSLWVLLPWSHFLSPRFFISSSWESSSTSSASR